MFARLAVCVTAVFLFAPTIAPAAPYAGEWQSVEIVKFTDFDDLEVKLGVKNHKAFLVGLTPIRESVKGKEEQQRAREAALDLLKKSELSAQVVTPRGEVLGLSIDAFAHEKHGFSHEWDPNKYPYCWSGWGAYNYNVYFLYTKATTYQDNFGENDHWREYFAQAVKKISAK